MGDDTEKDSKRHRVSVMREVVVTHAPKVVGNKRPLNKSTVEENTDRATSKCVKKTKVETKL